MLLRITARFALIAALGFVALGSHISMAAAATMAPMPGPTASGMAKPAGSPTPVPTPTTPANPAETAFIAAVRDTLRSKYSTTAAAAAAGYFQMTRLEDDGTVIWFNGKWNGDVSEDAPNFLWYDKAGNLVGLDYQYTVNAYPTPPDHDMYPVMAARWTTIDAHIHFAYKLPDGTIKRRGAELLPGETTDPTAGQLKAAKLLPANATLLWAHYHPKTWDLGFWLVPNVNGPFADANPAVKP